MKLENLKGQKLIEPIYFCFLKEKFLFWRKFLPLPPKQVFLTFAKKVIHLCFFFYPKMVPKRVLCASPKSTFLKKKSGSKMLSANQVAVFFDRQYLWKESSCILVIFHGVGFQAKAASEKAVVWSDVARFAFRAIRLYVSSIINILGENQVIS